MERFRVGRNNLIPPYNINIVNGKTKGRFSNENLPFLHTE